MGKATGFIEYAREEEKKRHPLSRLNNWKEYTDPFSTDTLARQGARCMDCGTPFCHMGIELQGLTSGCPIHNLIPEWNDLVYRGRWKEAFERLVKTNNFPEFTGRVCPAPCEGSCTVAISDPAVAIKGIERAIIDKAFEEGWVQPRIPKKRTGKKVAVIGSGPAGLACADELNQAGHFVTVYERADRIGGLLMYGIPNMKLGKAVVERRVRLLEKEGITFVTNIEVGKDLAMDELRKQYDAVVLCIGAQKQRDLMMEGRELDGVHFAMDYLTMTTKWLLTDEKDEAFIDAKHKHVIVIGGGDTGADCVATALRQQCKSVVQFGKHPALPKKRTNDNPWPQYPLVFTVDYAYEEAEAKFGNDPRQYCIQTKKIVGDERGRVKELHTIQMEKIIDDQGRAVFKEIPGTEKIWPCDLVLIAIGFERPEPQLLQQFGIETVSKAYKTNVEGVFVAGDARRGQSLVVWAIHEGREAAKEMNHFLMDK
ncbi:glutamate synthase subunit beta [uncultured Anoxybacillus sp.]|uniref:glutamate synthase subunit beta n=2 Tax=Anoxybacillus TaxID=150247 RepID=UPI002608CB3F|nr:glutamate synthase subunit beta [uncultured Anoxybacillus sp.]